MYKKYVSNISYQPARNTLKYDDNVYEIVILSF